MGDGVSILTTVLFALVALFILSRLRSVLGRRTGTERPPGEALGRTPVQGTATVHPFERPTIAAPVRNPGDPRSLEQGLAEVAAADRNFDEHGFVEGATGAFKMIVDAYAKGDTATLRPLLAPSVYESFAESIKGRTDAGETLETTIATIHGADVIEARMEASMAIVTVRFTTEQINLLRDRAGTLLDGAPNEAVEMVDLWTFARDVRSTDPNWQLIATRTPHH